jgi:hypothetical protein
METLQRRLVIGLRCRADWKSAIDDLFSRLLPLLRLPPDELEKPLRSLTDNIAELVYVEELSFLAVRFDDTGLKIDFIYDPGDDEHDELDLTPLEILDWGDIPTITVQLGVRNRSCAEYLQSDRLLRLAGSLLKVEIVDAGSGPSDEQGGDVEDTKEKSGRLGDAERTKTELLESHGTKGESGHTDDGTRNTTAIPMRSNMDTNSDSGNPRNRPRL